MSRCYRSGVWIRAAQRESASTGIGIKLITISTINEVMVGSFATSVMP
jgi:hypothetical protein